VTRGTQRWRRARVIAAGVVLGWLAAPLAASGQDYTGRGFAEVRAFAYPQTTPGDLERVVAEGLLRYEGSYRVTSWLRVAGALDARIDTHGQVERRWVLDWSDRSLDRPPFSARRLSATLNRGPFSIEVGKQFVRWGKADILNPTDRFAPRDYMTVIDNDFLAVTAARLIYESKGNTIDAVWVPRFTPSRLPLFDQRWTAIPPVVGLVAVVDEGARYPAGSQAGLRWNHLGSGYEFSVSYYDGFNHLPLIQTVVSPPPSTLNFIRTYPRMRMYGADAAVPLRWFTVKGEIGYFASPTPDVEEYGIYVLQLERQIGEWQLVGGYAGDFLTRTGAGAVPASPAAPTFAADRGLARALLGRVSYTIDTNSSLAFEVAARQNGAGTWVKAEYSRASGAHLRTTVEANLIRGRANDFLGQYRRNSNVNLAVRYSF
jgi:hypothetical protein